MAGLLIRIGFWTHEAARRKVSITGRRSTSRSPHQPAASASTAPLSDPSTGTHSDTTQLNSNTSVSYTHLDVYKRQKTYRLMPARVKNCWRAALAP